MPVLDDIFTAIRQIYESKRCKPDTSIMRSEMQNIVTRYNNNLRGTDDSTRPCYETWQTRWAYTYVFILRHSHLVKSALDILIDDMIIQSWVSNWKTVRVGCIGGGPGTDILGLIWHLQACNLKVEGYIFDKYPEWEETWKEMHGRLPNYLSNLVQSVKYKKLEMADRFVLDDIRRILGKLDILTFVKFVSSVAAWASLQAGFACMLTDVFEALPIGAYILFVDNLTGIQGSLFKARAKDLGLKEVKSLSTDLTCPYRYELSPENNAFKNCFDFFPAVRSCNFVCLYQKVERVQTE